MVTPLYTQAATFSVTNPSTAQSIIPAGNAGDSLQIAAGQANAIRYKLELAGVFQIPGAAATCTIVGKIGTVTIINVQNVDLAGAAGNGLQLISAFTVLPNGTVLRRSSLFVDGDLAEVLSQYVTDEPKTPTAAISANPLTLTIITPSGSAAGNVLTVTDFQLTQQN